MGNQLGLFSRIFMTLLCVLAIWSSLSAPVLFVKRRRSGPAPTDQARRARIRPMGVVRR